MPKLSSAVSRLRRKFLSDAHQLLVAGEIATIRSRNSLLDLVDLPSVESDVIFYRFGH